MQASAFLLSVVHSVLSSDILSRRISKSSSESICVLNLSSKFSINFETPSFVRVPSAEVISDWSLSNINSPS